MKREKKMNNEGFVKKLNEKMTRLINKSTMVEQAMAYSLLSAGKRIRPVLIKLICEDMGVQEDLIWNPAMAVELFHTASLIHDDLPQIDDSPLRRGRPSCHVVFGNDMAILAGDGLMLMAFCVLNQTPADPVSKSMLFDLFSKSTYDVLIGEAMDVEFTGKEKNINDVIEMYRKKTGALFSFCFAIGAILMKKLEYLEKLINAGSTFGVWFQIVDDLKDVSGKDENVGKTTGRDKALGKPTVVNIMGIQEAKNFADNLYESVIVQLKSLSLNKVVDFLCALRE
ncbi:polyprenyl synthetase family protein [Pseudothermotoga elfii]|uniref:polyprenyl synthetase family protein n=1 Tax=Pseudothermotoga elfii TaxID=38322 RepID=UPI000491C670|nr:polyprenyl synthetase family protein [Pseudothermotoga elfii]